MPVRRPLRPFLLPVLLFVLLARAAPTRRRRMLTCLMRWVDDPDTSSSHPILFVARDGVPIPDAIEHGFRITGALMNNTSTSPGGRDYTLTQEEYELVTTALRTRLAALPAELAFDDTRHRGQQDEAAAIEATFATAAANPTVAAAVAARVDALRRELGGLRPLVDMVYGDSYWDELVAGLRVLALELDPRHFRRWTLTLASFELFNPVQVRLRMRVSGLTPTDTRCAFACLCVFMRIIRSAKA